jgi:hypothetical protein
MIILSDIYGNLIRINHFGISTGDKNGFYTLKAYGTRTRHSRDDEGNVSTEIDDASVYIKNLSTDKAQALDSAREYLSKNYPSAKFSGVVNFDLDEIARISREQAEARRAAEAARVASTDFSVFQGGKYAGRSVTDVLAEDKGYCEWFANQCWKGGGDHARTAEIIKAILAPEREAAAAAAASLAKALLSEVGDSARSAWVEGRAGSFLHSISNGLLQGRAPEGRALYILLECIAKQVGSKNTKAFKAYYAELVAKFGSEE